MNETFNTLDLDEKIIAGLEKQNITRPTEIQSTAVPIMLKGKDIIAQSITGSGKTLAYLLPLFQQIDVTKKDLQAIILVPTHELAVQINDEIRLLAKGSGCDVASATLIGNVSIKRQIEKLKSKPHIVVGSPVRMLELAKLKKLKPHSVKTIVIDEGDRMLNVEHIRDVQAIIKTTLKERQLVVFSATISPESLENAKGMMKDPEEVMVNASRVNKNIKHFYKEGSFRDKFKHLRQSIANEKPEKAIVFINKNERIQEIVERLNYHDIKAIGIFGNASKLDRKKAMDLLKSGKKNILVSSDLVARGMDIKGVTHIFNLDLPQNLNVYLHRIGRTGRAFNTGKAISLVTNKEVEILKKIERKYSLEMTEIKNEELNKIRPKKDRADSSKESNLKESNLLENLLNMDIEEEEIDNKPVQKKKHKKKEKAKARKRAKKATKKDKVDQKNKGKRKKKETKESKEIKGDSL